jgi:hypothetical protein
VAREHKNEYAGTVGAFVHVQETTERQVGHLETCLFPHFPLRRRKQILTAFHVTTDSIVQAWKEPCIATASDEQYVFPIE